MVAIIHNLIFCVSHSRILGGAHFELRIVSICKPGLLSSSYVLGPQPPIFPNVWVLFGSNSLPLIPAGTFLTNLVNMVSLSSPSLVFLVSFVCINNRMMQVLMEESEDFLFLLAFSLLLSHTYFA